MDRQAELVVVDDLVTAEPGHVAQTSIRLRNTSDRVAHYALRPAPSGPAAAWVRIVPDEIRLLEGDDGQADVFIQPPPGDQSAAGRVPYAIIADPGPDSGLLPTVAEADVAVGAVHALDARLVPARTRGRFNGKLRAEFANLGNDEVRIAVTGSDESDGELLHFATADGRVTVPPGGSAAAFMKIRPDKPIVIGKPVDHPFVVTYTRRAGRSAQLESATANEVSATLTGTFTQKPIVSKWMMVVGALIVALAALVFLVRQATAADPVPPAPVVPKLVDDDESEGVLSLVFEVPDNPAHVEVQLVEEPVGGHFDLAPPLADPVVSEGDGQRRRVELTLDESDVVTDVYFRFRSVNADQRPSVWAGTSVVRSSSIAFEAPTIVSVVWSDCGEVTVTWSTPAITDGTTIDHTVRNAESSTPIDADVSGNSAVLPVPDAPFPVQVQVFDVDDPTRRSAFSEPMAPEDEPPAQCKLPAPTLTSVEWTIDGEGLTVQWTYSPPRPTVRVQLTDDNGNPIQNATSTGPTSALVPILRDAEAFAIRARAVDDATAEFSALSEPMLPSGSRPAPPTTTAPTTVPPPTTPPPTTAAPLPKPVGFWILPQGLTDATQSDRVLWGQQLGGLPIMYVAGESDLSDLEAQTGPLPATRVVWVFDGFATPADAADACSRLLQGLVDSGASAGPPSDCWVVGPDVFQQVNPPDPPPTTSP